MSGDIAALLVQAQHILHQAGVENPGLDAEVLLAHALGVDRAGVYRMLRDAAADEVRQTLFDLVKRRAGREPLQYITGRQEFYGLEFAVNPAVLIPRPETETLVDEAVSLLSGRGASLAADIGTGSGCIAVSLAANLPDLAVYAVDSQAEAVRVARQNILSHGVADRVELIEGSLFGPLAGRGLEGRLDLIASNPPYIPSGEIPGLQAEVLFEPRAAQDGGPDGLDVVRELIAGAPEFLKPGGTLLIETGFGQAGAVQRLVRKSPGLMFEKYIRDFAGIERVLVARRVE